MIPLNVWNVCQYVQRPISGCCLPILNWIKRDSPTPMRHYCMYAILCFDIFRILQFSLLNHLNRKNLSTYEDIAIVHIYYPLVESTLFRADVLMTWQEIVSRCFFFLSLLSFFLSGKRRNSYMWNRLFRQLWGSSRIMFGIFACKHCRNCLFCHCKTLSKHFVGVW